MKQRKEMTLSKAKKKLWTLFSIYIRMRDCIETTGSISWGICITCGKRYHFKLLQAGHFVAGRHNAGLFSEQGVHAQCYNCNINLKGNTLEYRRQIVKKYGVDADIRLEIEAAQTLQYKVCDLEDMIEVYKAKIRDLEIQNKVPDAELK
jgi:hypothetical protein